MCSRQIKNCWIKNVECNSNCIVYRKSKNPECGLLLRLDTLNSSLKEILNEIRRGSLCK